MDTGVVSKCDCAGVHAQLQGEQAARKAAESRLELLNDERARAERELQHRNDEISALRELLRNETIALTEANHHLQNFATVDSLTGLKNDRAFHDQLDREWHGACRYHRSLSMILLDIDHFQGYKAAQGQAAGDAVLQQVAHALQNSVRQCDTVARYGGEQFAIILPYTHLSGAATLARRFQALVAALPNGITVSMGVSTCRPPIPSATALVAEADRALSWAQDRGGNGIGSVAAAGCGTPNVMPEFFNGARLEVAA